MTKKKPTSLTTTKPTTPTHQQDRTPQPKDQTLKQVRKWTEYASTLVDIGLRPQQIEAVKVFITQDVKTVANWARLAGVTQQSLNHWWLYDEVFKDCLSKAAEAFMDAVIPFGLRAMAKRVMAGDETSLIRSLQHRGKAAPSKHEVAVGRWEELVKEWKKDD